MPVLKDPAGYFWSKVNKTKSCWLWTGYCKNGRYGSIKFEGVYYQASAFSYMLTYGLTEKPKLHVLHKCDVPACVNPDHLFLGTHQDNMADMVRKKRHLVLYTPEINKKRWANRSRRPEDHPMYGKKRPKEVAEKVGAAHRQLWADPDYRQKMVELAKQRSVGGVKAALEGHKKWLEKPGSRESLRKRAQQRAHMRRSDGTFKRKGEV